MQQRPPRSAPAVRGEDRISALPEALLLHTLSLLPSEEAVRTCVLARRWRNLWKYTPTLRLVHDYGESFSSAELFNKFVNHLIALRGGSRLVNCEIEIYPPPYGKTCPYVQSAELWIHYALACKVQALNVFDDCGEQRLVLNVPFISRHLKTLHLESVDLMCSVDFSSCCPVLEDLKLTQCFIWAHKISSKSLKRLCLTSCSFSEEEGRTRISVPGLLSLLLEDCFYRTPLLESMPLLETAFVRLDDRCEDDCDYGHGICDKTDCHGCYGFESHQSVLLNSLSNATNLELIAPPEKYIFRRGVASCPLFSRLKTLLLSEWCATFDMYSLVRVLRLAPILEKLTLQICNNGDIVNPIGAEGKHVPTEQSSICAQLKVANIECQELDEKVRKIWNILRICGVHPEKISIKNKQSGLYRFSYDRLQ